MRCLREEDCKSTSAGTGGDEVGSPACMRFACSASLASSCRAAATAGSRACTLGMLPLEGRAAGASKNVSLGLLSIFCSLSLDISKYLSCLAEVWWYDGYMPQFASELHACRNCVSDISRDTESHLPTRVSVTRPAVAWSPFWPTLTTLETVFVRGSFTFFGSHFNTIASNLCSIVPYLIPAGQQLIP